MNSYVWKVNKIHTSTKNTLIMDLGTTNYKKFQNTEYDRLNVEMVRRLPTNTIA